MRYYQYFWKILVKYKWVLLATVGIPVVATVLFCLLATPVYEADAEIYPMVMKKDAEMMPLNPCYQVQRIVHSREFQQLLIDSKLSGTLSEKNYDHRVQCHETPRHTLVITAGAETPASAEELTRQFLTQLDFAVSHLPSVQLAQNASLCEQIPWDYYHHQVDFVPASSVREHSDSSCYFLFDVLSEPTSSATPVYPPDLLKTMILVFIISAFLSFTGVCLFEEIRNRFHKTSPAQ